MSKDSLRRLVRLNGDFVGTTDSQELTNKTLAAESNIIKSTTPALGNILKDNGTKYVPLTKGSAGLPLRVNDAATDIGYTALGVAGGGTGVATISSGSLLVGAGTSAITTKAAPAGAILGDSDVQNITGAKTFTNQTLKARNPAGTATMTYTNPAITSDKTGFLGRLSFDYILAKVGTTYYALDKNSAILSSSTDFQTVLQTAIDQCETDGGGDIFIPALTAGDPWILPGGFTGFTIGNATAGSSPDVENIHIFCARGARFKIPNTFTGTFCTFTNGTTNCSWTGGWLYQSTPNQGWVGFELIGTTQAGNCFARLRDIMIRYASVAIKLTNDGPQGFVNGNEFQNVITYSCDTGILFNQVETYSSGVNGISRNTFMDFIMEHNNRANAFYGVKDVSGRGNRFLECKVWDILQTASYHTCTITANSEYTIIDGGIMTQVGWPADNLSATTIVNDMWTPTRLGKGQIYADVAKTANYTLTKADHIVRVDGSGGAFTITLPTAVSNAGREFTIRRTDILASSNLVTIDPASTETINGTDKDYLAPGQCVVIESDGTNWQVLARTPTPSYSLKGATADRRIAIGVIPWSSAVLANASITSTVDTLIALPFIVQQTTKFDTMTFRVVTVGTAGSVARMGLYRDTGNCYPGALIWDSGSIATDSGTGGKNATITAAAQIFPPGLYWGAIQFGTAGPTVRTLTGQTHLIGVLGLDSGGGSANYGYGYSVTNTGTSALPDPYTAAGTILTTAPAAASAPVPIMSLRAI